MATTSDLRTVFRAVIGAASLGIEELAGRARVWDDETAGEQAAAVDECTERESEINKDVTGRADDPRFERCIYILIGFVLDAADTASTSAKHIDRLQQELKDTIVPYFELLAETGLGRHIYEMSLLRLDGSVSRWAEVGRMEHARGKVIAKRALSDLSSIGIDKFADSPEVREMVKSQSAGIAVETIDSVRQQAATADRVVERVARRLLGRKPKATDQ